MLVFRKCIWQRAIVTNLKLIRKLKTKNQNDPISQKLRISQYSQRSTQQEQREINGLRIDKITCSVTQPAMECAQQQQ